MIIKNGKATEDNDLACKRIRGRGILLVNCLLDDGTEQEDCLTCPVCKKE